MKWASAFCAMRGGDGLFPNDFGEDLLNVRSDPKHPVVVCVLGSRLVLSPILPHTAVYVDPLQSDSRLLIVENKYCSSC